MQLILLTRGDIFHDGYKKADPKTDVVLSNSEVRWTLRAKFSFKLVAKIVLNNVMQVCG
jgi:hypothetical protein